MAFKKFKKVITKSLDLNKLQDNLTEVWNSIVKNTLLDSAQLTNISLKSGQINKIAHGLGRPLVKWTLIDIQQAAQVYSAQASNKSPELYLYLQCTADCTVSLEVA